MSEDTASWPNGALLLEMNATRGVYGGMREDMYEVVNDNL
jgi:hypothetical protein